MQNECPMNRHVISISFSCLPLNVAPTEYISATHIRFHSQVASAVMFQCDAISMQSSNKLLDFCSSPPIMPAILDEIWLVHLAEHHDLSWSSLLLHWLRTIRNLFSKWSSDERALVFANLMRRTLSSTKCIAISMCRGAFRASKAIAITISMECPHLILI